MNYEGLPRAWKGRVATQAASVHPWFRKQHLSWDLKVRRSWVLWKRGPCGDRVATLGEAFYSAEAGK